MRRLTTFSCGGETLAGTLDEASGTTGLLIVSGGNEIRVGAHRGMAMLAERLAQCGMPVFRFDRRGIGDSTGENAGFRSSAPDIACAAAAFRAQAGIERLAAFGNCDAASALALFGAAAGIDRLVLANPWVVDPTDDLPPAAAIRARYAAKLKNPHELLRLLRGGVDIVKLGKGLLRMSATAPEPAAPATELVRALSEWGDHATVLLATGDATAIAYADVANRSGLATRTIPLDSASHSFAGAGDAEWLYDRILESVNAAGNPTT